MNQAPTHVNTKYEKSCCQAKFNNQPRHPFFPPTSLSISARHRSNILSFLSNIPDDLKSNLHIDLQGHLLFYLFIPKFLNLILSFEFLLQLL